MPHPRRGRLSKMDSESESGTRRSHPWR